VGMEDTLLEYPSWVGNVYWFCLWASIFRYCSYSRYFLTVSPHAALGGIALLGTTIAKTSNQLLGWNVAYSFIGSVSLRRHAPAVANKYLPDRVRLNERHWTREIPRPVSRHWHWLAGPWKPSRKHHCQSAPLVPVYF